MSKQAICPGSAPSVQDVSQKEASRRANPDRAGSAPLPRQIPGRLTARGFVRNRLKNPSQTSGRQETMDLKHRIRKAFSVDTYSLDAAIRNVNRLKWGLRNLPGYFQTVGGTYLDPAARSQLAERRRKLQVEELLAQLDKQELERIRLRYEDGRDSIWPKYLDARKWLSRNIDYARRFGWLLAPPQDTLDLGCGAGYFL